MNEVSVRSFLPALMGALRQRGAEGELVLEQNDGVRRLHWTDGHLSDLRSDAGGEQFGNYLVRLGVIDMASLKAMLAEGEGVRVGDQVVQLRLLKVEERDARLQELQSSILLHALEHPVLSMTWKPGGGRLASGDDFRLDPRRLLWDVFQNAQIDRQLVEMFRSEPDWRWRARADLLDSLSDLPLTPALAFALSMLGAEALGCDTMVSLTGLKPLEVFRMVAMLWALGGLNLVEGELPQLPGEELNRAPEAEPVITLVDEEAADPTRGQEPPHPMNLMDILAMEEPALDVAPPSPAGPLPGRDPFSPGLPPAHAPIPEPVPPAAAFPFQPSALPPDPFRAESGPPPDPFQAAAPPPTFDPTVTPSQPLPLIQDEDKLTPRERAKRLVGTARTLMGQARTSEAIRALEQAIKLDGDSHESYHAWLLLGRLRMENPAWSTRVIEALQTAARLHPRAAEPWVLMGKVYLRKGFAANAQGCFRRALELDPSVAVPESLDEADLSARAARESKPGGPGIMGRLKSILGREKS